MIELMDEMTNGSFIREGKGSATVDKLLFLVVFVANPSGGDGLAGSLRRGIFAENFAALEARMSVTNNHVEDAIAIGFAGKESLGGTLVVDDM